MPGQGGSSGGAVALEDYITADPDAVPQQGKPDIACRGCEQAGHRKPREAKRKYKNVKLKSRYQILQINLLYSENP